MNQEKSPPALFAVGTGGTHSHSGDRTTAEATFRIDEADKVFAVADLDDQLVFDSLRHGDNVCIVGTGHPAVYGAAALRLVSRVREAGFQASVVPGISIEDALFADAGMDPADRGSQSFDARDFVLAQRKWDPMSALFLWRVSALWSAAATEASGGDLGAILAAAYPSAHPVLVYDPVFAAGNEPDLRWTTIADAVTLIITLAVSAEAGIVVPPLDRGAHHEERARRLGIDPRVLT